MFNNARYAQPPCLISMLVALLVAAPGAAGAQEIAEKSVADLSLEDLLNIRVTTASRKSQALSDVPAAIFVITGEDIQRSGATSIPEALRMAPGVEVAKIGNNKWAVSIRGFNGRFANKLLVLMDGRSVYSPLFSGLFWEAEDTLLEDIDRIEVIRGPGAALWGANAVNGVINIITRKARDTQGGLLIGVAGNQEGAGAALRYGGRVDERTHYRVYAKSFDRNASIGADGQPAHDTWRANRIGYRMDRESDGGRSSLIAEAYDSHAGDQWTVPLLEAPYADVQTFMQKNSGFSLLGRTEQVLDNGSEWSLRASFASTRLDVGGFGERRDTLDIDFQYRFRAAPAHDLMWGWNYRNTSDDLTSTFMLEASPASRKLNFAGVFVQDDFTLLPDTLKAIVGARLEQRTSGSLQTLPNLRLLWTMSPTQSMWASAARAVRTPSRGELDVTARLAVIPPFSADNPSPFPVSVQTAPGSATGFGDERMDAIELGYRKEFAPNLSLDATIFQNHYTDLRGGPPPSTLVPVGFPIPSYLALPITIDNSASAHTRGLEATVEWRPQSWWRLQGVLSLFRADVSFPSGDPLYADNSPTRQFSLRSSMNLSGSQQLDASIKYVGQLQGGLVPAYTRLDLRYAWKPARNLELALVGQNLLDSRHREFIADYLPSQVLDIKRSIYLKANWKF